MRFKKTVIAVAVFVAALTYGFAHEAQADVKPILGLATGVLGPFEGQTQILGAMINDRWGIQYERFPEANSISAYRRVYFRREHKVRPLLEIGATYFDTKVVNSQREDTPIVDASLAYHLAFGAQFRVGPYTTLELKWTHNSTAGRSNPNTGIDRVSLTYTWSL